MKKELLLIIYDHLDFQLLMNNNFYSILNKEFNITILTPYNKDNLFREEVSKEFPSIKVLDSWPQKNYVL